MTLSEIKRLLEEGALVIKHPGGTRAPILMPSGPHIWPGDYIVELDGERYLVSARKIGR